MKVLVAVDGSAYTQRAVDYLDRHGWLSGAHRLAFLTVVLPVTGHAAAFAGPAMTQHYYQGMADEVLQPLRDRLRERGLPADFLHEVGHPAECIARHATEGGYDLVAMGSHGHRALANLVLGSVATEVLARCRVPVLIVR